ncbi:hypothetical protein EC991_005655 [Linnemannia zychae]|nr:hypothetical protein EC991_005655 [Linnemannia zychae]
MLTNKENKKGCKNSRQTGTNDFIRVWSPATSTFHQPTTPKATLKTTLKTTLVNAQDNFESTTTPHNSNAKASKPTMIARTPYLLLIAALAMLSARASADVFSDSMPFADQINAAGERLGVWLQDNGIIDKPSGGDEW